MAWFEKEINYARESLAQVSKDSIELAGDKLGAVVKEGAANVGAEMREVVHGASQEIDAKLDKISVELHNQRQFTKDDVRELVDYAADRLGNVLDERVAVAKREISSLVQDKVEYFKHEVDSFFIQRQQDLARERRRLFYNVLIAFSASILVGFVSWLYQHFVQGSLDLFGVFRIVFASLTGGYAVYLLVRLILRWQRMSEHRKDVMFLTMRYWGALRPESIFSTLLLICILALLFGLVLFPDILSQIPGGKQLLLWVHDIEPRLRR